MGLAGRKTKQRIPNDPRNLSWADDANKFGAAYLQKLGWSAGTGLGTEGEGRTTHIKVEQKLDMLGIGAAHQRDPNGLAWKQNRDFENLLKRLNNGGMEIEEEKGTKVDGFYRATEEDKGDKEDVKEGKVDKKEKKKRKRHEKDEEKAEVDEESEKKKEKKKRKQEKKERKERQAGSEDDEPSPAPSISTPTPPRPVRAHRARFLASKRLASKSTAAMDEILGISRSGTSTPYPTTSLPESPPDSASPSPTPGPEDGLKLQELTTSSKSVMDYFREKLAAKSNSTSTSASSSSSPGPSTPREDEQYDDYDDRPRGLGMGSRGGLGASKLRQEVSFEEKVEETSSRAGLGAFSRMSAMFSAAKETTESKDQVIEQVTVEKMELDVVELEGKRTKKKKDKGKGKESDTPEADEGEVKEKSKKKSKKDRRKDADVHITEDAHDIEESSRKKKSKSKVAEPEDDASQKKKKKSKKVKSQESVDSDS